MGEEMRRATTAVLLVLAMACVNRSPSPTIATASMNECPYLRIYQSGGIEAGDRPKSSAERALDQRMDSALRRALEQEGYAFVGDSRDHYWILATHLMTSDADEEVFIGNLRLSPVPGITTAALSEAWEGHGGASFLIEYRITELEAVAHKAVEWFVKGTLIQTDSLCADWYGGRWEEEARLERVRQELVEEMEHLRRWREEQRKQLQLEIENSK